MSLVDPWWTPLMMGAVGLCVGSFLNVVVRRLPLMLERQWWREAAALMDDDAAVKRLPDLDADAIRHAGRQIDTALDRLPPLSLSRPRSHCPVCHAGISTVDLLPVVGWWKLRGRCRGCQAPIGWRYPAVEILTALTFAAMAWRWEASPVGALWAAWAAMLIALSLIDWDTTLLPDVLTLPLVWTGLLAAGMGWTPVDLMASLWGACIGWFSLWAVGTVFRWLRGTEGMGAGDAKLLAGLGAWLGVAALPTLVLAASVVGAAVGLAMKARGQLREGRYLPFGPFLSGAALGLALAGPQAWRGWAPGVG